MQTLLSKLQNETFGHWIPIIGDTLLLKYRAMLMQATLNGIPIEPSPEKVLHCFRVVQPEDVKVVLLGQDPYSDGNATGLAFANDTEREGFKTLSPSLQVIKNSVLSLAKPEEMPIFDPSLESWAKQGVLLLNSALTVKKGIPGSHMDAWRPFIERVLTGISAETNACFLLFGRAAHSFKDCIFDNNRGVFMEYHPAYYARNNMPMPNTIWKNMLDYVEENFGTKIRLYE